MPDGSYVVVIRVRRMPSGNQKVNVVMQIVITMMVLVSGILVLTAPNFAFPATFDDSVQKWAAGWVGALIGYWLS